jgi:4a-hydroxytetrahydrobiopterin dehydratase
MEITPENIKLENRQCKPCEGNVAALQHDQATRHLQKLTGWELSEDGSSIARKCNFNDFSGTIFFINALAFISEQQGHHPDFCAGYNYCEVTFTTHAINGLSENDFICAAKINDFLEP